MKHKKYINEIDSHEVISQVIDNKVVVYRNLELIDEDQLIKFCHKLGTMLAWDFGHVMHLRVKENTKNYLFTTKDVPYHWDGAFHKEPQLLIFFCLKSPENNEGGETLFCNTESIIQDLSAEELNIYQTARFRYSTEKLAHYGGTVEANLVQKHPITGNNILRFAEVVDYEELNPVSVEMISPSDQVNTHWHTTLINKLYNSKYCYAHSWKPGDLVIADNFSLLHGRKTYKSTSERHLLRAQILNIHETLYS